MKACPSCQTLNEDEATFCINCREKIEGSTLYCSNCGNKIVSSNKFCKFCGSEVKKIAPVLQQTDVPEKPVVALVTPPQKKKRNKKLIITLSIVLSVLFIFLVIIFIVISIPSGITKPYENRFTTDYPISKDQRTAISRWGHPDGFLLAIDPKTNDRFESWFYYIMGSEMIFVNGKFMEGNDLTIYDVTETKDELTVYPYEFTSNARINDIIEVLGAPTLEDNYQDGKLTIMYYKKQLVITLLDSRVTGVTFFHTELDEIK